MAWNKAGTVLAIGHQDATIQLWSHTGQPLRSQAQHSAPVFDLAWSDDGNRLISAGLDGVSICWDTSVVNTTHSLWVNRGHEGMAPVFILPYERLLTRGFGTHLNADCSSWHMLP